MQKFIWTLVIEIAKRLVSVLNVSYNNINIFITNVIHSGFYKALFSA